MGTWGTEINGNDAFMDIYQIFFDRYNRGRGLYIFLQTLCKPVKYTAKKLPECSELQRMSLLEYRLSESHAISIGSALATFAQN